MTARESDVSPHDLVDFTDRDEEILDQYESWGDIDDAADLADYMNALGRLIAVSTPEDSFDVNELLRMNGVAKDLRAGDTTVPEAQTWMEEDFAPAT